jgi:hypothetical protein
VSAGRPFDPARHSAYSDPGGLGALLGAVSAEPAAISEVARNLVVHYRASGHELPADTVADINLCWLDAILETDQRRHGRPLADPRDPQQRVQGCCRDHTLFAVGVLRQHGIRARSRVGFAGYFSPGHHHDHVVVEWWDQSRWVRFDPEVAEPGEALPTPLDIPRGSGAPFETAAEVWRRYRAGELDPATYAVEPGSEIGGPWFIRNYVFLEVAHRYGDELLLWDGWGAMTGPGPAEPADLELADEVAALLVAADEGDESALYQRYVADSRLHPGPTVTRMSPLGQPPARVELTRRGR